MTKAVARDVEALLMSTRKCRRKSGEVPYPVIYSLSMVDYDIWDHMFLKSCCKSLTMHQFSEPPKVVLDLGCGSGYWAIEAAIQWPSSTIVGLDLTDDQAYLNQMEPYRHLARRVKWVHGNLLDGLPFPPSHFDLVRITGLGLAIPEDEWQFVLEEVARVTRSGGVLEVIEEELIFPCPSFQPPISFVPLNTNVPPSRSQTLRSCRSTTTLRSGYTAEDENSLYPILENSSTTTLDHTTSPTSLKAPSTHSPPSRPLAQEYFTHPQDHSRLKEVWASMLATRFLCPNLLSVLPFYITSSSFIDVQTHAPCRIPLPPNSDLFLEQNKTSSQGSEGSLPDTMFDLKPTPARNSAKGKSSSSQVRMPQCQQNVDQWASMHLAKVVSTIKGCKEAMWEEYQKMYSDEAVKFSTESLLPNEVPMHLSFSSPCRASFEQDWRNWENDMQDRISMRSRVTQQLGWGAPPKYNYDYDWRVWRKSLVPGTSGFTGHVYHESDDTSDLCRSIRAFVGWKP